MPWAGLKLRKELAFFLLQLSTYLVQRNQNTVLFLKLDRFGKHFKSHVQITAIMFAIVVIGLTISASQQCI